VGGEKEEGDGEESEEEESTRNRHPLLCGYLLSHVCLTVCH
jgi:hypothetical protein